MGKYLNYPQPEKFPLAVRLQVREPGQDPVMADELREHEFSELILVVRGRAEHRVGMRYFPLEEGDVLIVHPGTVDSFSNLVDFEVVVVIYDASAPLPALEGANLPLIEFLYPRDGHEFDPTNCPAPDVKQGILERPLGGLGIYLTARLSESMKYIRKDGKNTLIITIRK